LCDGSEECELGDDERNCPIKGEQLNKFIYSNLPVTDICDNDEFQCKNGMCIANGLYCNNIKDCTDGTDEPSYCGMSVSTTLSLFNAFEFSAANNCSLLNGIECDGQCVERVSSIKIVVYKPNHHMYL
jgi:hypothetical protein